MSCEINFKETAVQRRSQRPNSGNHPPLLPETPDAHAVSGSLNISFSSQCLSLQWLCIHRPVRSRSYGSLFYHIFHIFRLLSCPYTSMAVDLSFSSSWPIVGRQHSSLVQCVWPCAPRRVSLSDKYNQGHPLAPSLRPVGAWQSPHNNSVLMVQLSQGWGGWGGGFFLWPQRTSGWGSRLKRLSPKDRKGWVCRGARLRIKDLNL